jgi:hypothetical protein
MSQEDNKSSKGQWHGGKGSIQKTTDHDKYADSWERIFGKKKPKEPWYSDKARPDGFAFDEWKNETKDN